MRTKIHKITIVMSALLLIAAPLVLHTGNTEAGYLQFRSVTLSSASPSAQSTQSFTFTVPTTSSIGSIEFEHCTNDPYIGNPCTAPNGLSLNTAILSAQSNNTGFTIDALNSTVNRMVLTRTASAGNVGATSYTFTGVVNPSTPAQTVYVRMATFSSTDGTGARNDSGSVAYSIVSNFSVGAYVPPFLTFCAGVIVSLDCSASNGLLISFGELSPTQTKTATSQFSGATNDYGGYSVFISGQTMTAGNQIINPIIGSQPSSVGSAQFGINLRGNTNPVVGADYNGAGTAAASGLYNSPNQYRFVSGEQLVSSPLSTDFNRYTVSYIVNIVQGQAAGYYATTLTYVAVAAF